MLQPLSAQASSAPSTLGGVAVFGEVCFVLWWCWCNLGSMAELQYWAMRADI